MRTIGMMLLVAALAGVAYGEAKSVRADANPAAIASVKGKFTFGGTTSTWSAKLTAKGDGTYDAAYEAMWGGKPVTYLGTIKTDGKTEISGSGKASGAGANGVFEFSGKYGADGIAQGSYKEVGGRRSGSITAEIPK